MSTTIGIGCSCPDRNDVFEELQVLAGKFGYGLLNGIDHAESDVRGGLQVAKENEGWECLMLLQSPKDNQVGLAFGIHEELTRFETMGVRPRFFDFLVELFDFCSGGCDKLSVFFAAEWCDKDRIRFSYGGVDGLIALLSLPGHWGGRYLIPETWTLQDSDEVPLIFDFNIS